MCIISWKITKRVIKDRNIWNKIINKLEIDIQSPCHTGPIKCIKKAEKSMFKYSLNSGTVNCFRYLDTCISDTNKKQFVLHLLPWVDVWYTTFPHFHNQDIFYLSWAPCSPLPPPPPGLIKSWINGSIYVSYIIFASLIYFQSLVNLEAWKGTKFTFNQSESSSLHEEKNEWLVSKPAKSAYMASGLQKLGHANLCNEHRFFPSTTFLPKAKK